MQKNSGQIKQKNFQSKSDRPERFDPQSRRECEKLCQEVAQVILDFSHKWDGDSLVIYGLEEKPITFNHPRSAAAGLELYLMGYDDGFGHGRTSDDEEDDGK